MSTVPGASAPLPPEAAHAELIPAAGASEWTPLTTPKRAMSALIALSVAGFIVVTNEIALLGLIKLMAKDLGRTESEIGLVVTGFAAVIVVASVPFAVAVRRIQRRAVIGGSLAFVAVGALVVGLSDTFALLLVGRLISALGQAAFWAVANPTSTALFSPKISGKVTARMLIGTSAAGVVGLPAVTRLGQLTEWRTPFFVVAGIAAVLAVFTWVLIPSYSPDAGGASRAPQPSRRRFVAILTVVTLAAGATAITYTYITPFLVDVTGVSEAAVPGILLVGGLFGVVGMLTVGKFLDNYPLRTVAVVLVALLVVWTTLFLLGAVLWAAVIIAFAQSFTWSCFIAAGVNRIMRHAPGSLDVGVAANATFYNTGTMLGSLLGAAMLAGVGARWLPGASALAVALAIAVLAFEWRRLAGGQVPTRAEITQALARKRSAPGKRG